MKLFDYRCECGRVRELPDESPPLCDYCGCQMSRVFTPSYIRVKGGTPNFHGHVKQDVAEEKEREQGISEWESEQKQRREAMRERKKAKPTSRRSRVTVKGNCITSTADLTRRPRSNRERNTATSKIIRLPSYRTLTQEERKHDAQAVRKYTESLAQISIGRQMRLRKRKNGS